MLLGNMLTHCLTLIAIVTFDCSIGPGLAANAGGGESRPNEIVTTNHDVNNKSATRMHQLTKSVFANYDKELMPTKPVYVKLDVLLLKVKTTVERDGIFESVIALFIEWYDKRMVWDPTEYDNVTVLAFDSEKVWLPDIAMINSADGLYDISRDTRFVIRASYDGRFKYVPTGTARTWCDLKLMTFPFDEQTCSLEFESWSLDTSTMAFENGSKIIIDENFLSLQWQLCSQNSYVHTVYYNFTGESFSRVTFNFTVRRKSVYYLINLVFPCATLSVIQLLVFAIPSIDSSSDRVGFGTTNLLTLVVFQTIVTAEMPRTSDAVTILSKYIIALIILSSIGIFESVCVERLRRITYRPPPTYLVKLAQLLPWWGNRPELPRCAQSLKITDFNSHHERETSFSPASMTAIEQEHLQRTLSAKQSHTAMKRLCVNSSLNGSRTALNNDQRDVDIIDDVFPSTVLPTVDESASSLPARRKMSRFTAAKDERARRDFIERLNSELWGEIATVIDVISFTGCSFAVVAVALWLFFPMLYFGEECMQT